MSKLQFGGQSPPICSLDIWRRYGGEILRFFAMRDFLLVSEIRSV